MKSIWMRSSLEEEVRGSSRISDWAIQNQIGWIQTSRPSQNLRRTIRNRGILPQTQRRLRTHLDWVLLWFEYKWIWRYRRIKFLFRVIDILILLDPESSRCGDAASNIRGWGFIPMSIRGLFKVSPSHARVTGGQNGRFPSSPRVPTAFKSNLTVH